MVKFSTPSHNKRDAYQAYKQGTPFDDAGKRAKRMIKKTKRKRMSKEEFARRLKADKNREKQVVTALRNKDEAALQLIATEVAMFCLTV